MDHFPDILAIDDDSISQKIIARALTPEGISVRAAFNGEEGIHKVEEKIPDVILLDVEMPGMNGYEVCEHLRNNPENGDVPIVFLSSHGTLRERMQGYDAGADDYMVKPFEKEDLLARIKVLLKYSEERCFLEEKFQTAQKTAMIAMTGTSELGLAMKFVEKSYAYRSFDELAHGLFEVADQLQLECCMMVATGDVLDWYSSEGIIKPLEKELVEMADKEKRFLDFGNSTIINFPHLSLLVKNMPLDDLERYGRIKDLLPPLVSAVNSKINALNIESALLEQSQELLGSFRLIRTQLYHLAKEMIDGQMKGEMDLRKMVGELNYDLLRMGLDEDQEEFLIARVDGAIEETMERLDMRDTIHDSFRIVLSNLKELISKHQIIVDTYTLSQTVVQQSEESSYEGDIELF